MPALWTPTKVSREHADTTREWESAALSCMHDSGGILDHWNAELRLVDPNLRLMQASEHADVMGVLPGFYHLVRLRDTDRNDMLMVQPLRGPNDEFIEPSSQMLEALRACDLQNEQVRRERDAATLREEAARLRAIAREEECRRDEGVERFLAASRTQVLMSRDVPWSQNNSAAARRARGQKRG